MSNFEKAILLFFVALFILALYDIVAIASGQLPVFPAHIPGLY